MHALTGERGAYRLTRPIQAIEVPATVQVIPDLIYFELRNTVNAARGAV